MNWLVSVQDQITLLPIVTTRAYRYPNDFYLFYSKVIYGIKLLFFYSEQNGGKKLLLGNGI